MNTNPISHPNYAFYKQQAKYYGIEQEFTEFCNTRCMAELSVIMVFFTGRYKKYLNNFAQIIPFLRPTVNGRYEIISSVWQVTNFWKPYVRTPEQQYELDWAAQQKRNEQEIANTDYIIKLKTVNNLPHVKNIVNNSPHKKLLLSLIPRDLLHVDYLIELVNANIFYKNGKSHFPYICLNDMLQYFANFTEIDYSITISSKSHINMLKPISNKIRILYCKYMLNRNRHLSETELMHLSRANYGKFLELYGMLGKNLEKYNYPIFEKYRVGYVRNPLDAACIRKPEYNIYQEIPICTILSNVNCYKTYVYQDPYFYFIRFLSLKTRTEYSNACYDYSFNAPYSMEKIFLEKLAALFCNVGIYLKNKLIVPTRKIYNAQFMQHMEQAILDNIKREEAEKLRIEEELRLSAQYKQSLLKKNRTRRVKVN